METLVRGSDPVESHIAAASASETVTRDRLLMLRVFGANILSLSYREAAERAQKLEFSDEVARLESLRRRGSDLKRLGWIEQYGRYDGQAIFRITDLGRAALAAASN